MKKLLILFALLLSVVPAFSETAIGIEERLGAVIPLELEFRDERDSAVKLRNLFDRPVLMGLVYFHCPGVCVPFIEGVTKVLDITPSVPGEDYRVVMVSFSPADTPGGAIARKAQAFASMKNPPPANSWTFLTGDTAAIAALTSAVGFGFSPSLVNDGNFLHTTSLMVLSREGKIVRYMPGVKFLPAVIQMALVEAGENRIGATIMKAATYCFDVEPEGRKLTLKLTRLFGVIITVSALAFLIVLAVLRRKPK